MTVAERPFRDLCPEADQRDAMTDGEFWDHALNGPDGPELELEDMDPVDFDELDILAPCGVCGERGACGYDLEGRPLIHSVWAHDDGDES